MSSDGPSSLFRLFVATVQARSDVNNWSLAAASPGVLTYAAKNPETGPIVVYDDGHELTLEIGEHFHTHFGPNFGPTFSRGSDLSDEEVVAELVKVIDDFLSECTFVYKRYVGGEIAGGGLAPVGTAIDADEYRCYVWSGPYVPGW